MRETVSKKQTRFTYTQGPMFYIGQQIVRQMQESGHPCKIFEHYRDASRQATLKAQGASNAGPLQSAHNIGLAVDIIHTTRGWPPFEDPFWEALRVAGDIVGEKYGIPLVFGYDWGWDAAHIELKHYRRYLNSWRPLLEPLDDAQRLAFVQDHYPSLFHAELPSVWKQYLKSQGRS